MKTLTLNKYRKQHPMTFVLDQYASNGNLYVGLVTHEEGYKPWSDLTVNLDVKCEKNCSFIDTNNNGNEIIYWLVENGLGYTTGLEIKSGFCIYPEFIFNMDKLLQYVMEGDNHYGNEIKITNYSCYDNGIVSETENVSNIIDKMIQLAAKITERFASDIIYDINNLNDAITLRKNTDNLLFFHENGVTTRETNEFTANDYDSLLCCFTPIQTWRLTYSPDTMETKLIRVNVRKEWSY